MEITIEKYQNIIGMLRSTDPENKVVALTIINTIDVKDNITKLLLLKKHSNSTEELWEKHAPLIYKYFCELSERKIIDKSKHLTYKNVLKAITAEKVSAKEMQFYMADFGDYLLNEVHALGYEEIETLQITLKYKADE